MKTWEDIHSVDDLLIEQEIEIIKATENETEVRCPHLRKAGNNFYYCGGGIKEDIELKLEPFNKIISAKQEVVQLQLHCMDRYKACCHYNGSLPFP